MACKFQYFPQWAVRKDQYPHKSRKTHCNIYRTWIFMKPFFLRQISAFTMHPAGRIHNPHHHYPLERIYGAARHIPPTKASLLVSSDVVSSKIHHRQSWSAMEIKRKPYPHPIHGDVWRMQIVGPFAPTSLSAMITVRP